MPTSFFVRKRNHGEVGKNAFRSTKVPLPVRLFLNEGSQRYAFAPFLFYLELDRVFVTIISTFTLLVCLVMIKY